MSEIATKLFESLNNAAPLIHEDTSGTLPAGRIAIDGEHGEPVTNEGEASVLAYIPGTDDAGQWHPISDLISAAPATSITDGAFTLAAATIEQDDLQDLSWTDLQELALGAGSGRLTISASVPLSLDSAGNTIRTIDVRLVIDGYATASQTVTCATDSTAGNDQTATFSAITYSVPLLAQHRIRVQVDRAAGDAAAVIYTTGATITVVSDESEPLAVGGDLSGVTDAAEVVGIYGNAIDASAATPTSGDALVWDGTAWALAPVGTPVLYNGDVIYGSGFISGTPGANVNVPATSTVVGNSTTITGTTANTIDSNDTTSWRTFNNGYVTYDLGGSAPAIRGWRVRQLVSNPLFGATSIVLAGSNNNSTWTTIDTWTSAPTTDSGTRTLGADALYRYFRITGSGRTYFEVYTVELNVSSTVFAEETRLGIGSSGQVLTVSAGLPSWQNVPADAVTSVDGRTGVVTLGDLYDASGAATSAVASHVAAADPHPGYVLESLVDAKGDLIAGTAADTVGRLAVGTNSQILAADSTTASGLAWIDNFTTDVRTYVKNQSGATVNKGQAVYISGATGTNVLITLSDADTEGTSSKTLGLLLQDISNGSFGYVLTEGLLAGVDTSGATAEGDTVWLSGTPGGRVYGAPPAKPAHSVYLGVVARKHAVNGEILVKVQNGYELNELHNVNTAGVADGDVLSYDSANSRWVAAAPSGGGGGGDATSIQGTAVSETDPTTTNQAIVYDGSVYRPYRLKASDLATILTPIFNEDGTVVFDEDGVILAEVNN